MAAVVVLAAAVLAAVMLPTAVVAERGGETTGDGRGDVAGAATTANRLGAGRLQNPHAEDDGVNSLHHGGGYAPLLVAGLRLGAEGGSVRAGTENAHRAVAAKEDDLLFQHCDPVKLPRLTCTQTGLEDELDVEADVDGVKASVEADGVDADVGPGDAGILDANLGGALNDVPTEVGQKDPYVLKAVAVAAGIQNAVGFNTDGVGVAAPSATVALGTARIPAVGCMLVGAQAVIG